MDKSVCTAQSTQPHLQSSFITNLRQKYPRACNRSLTNLTELGLSLPDSTEANRSGLLTVSNNGDRLSAWSKGLSSSQPDLLKASGLDFYPLSAEIDIDAPSNKPHRIFRTSSTSGINLLRQYQNNNKEWVTTSTLSTSLIHERLRSSRLKMNELSSKITLISRSNSNLVDINGRDSLSLSAARSSRNYDVCNSDEEVDDSAPVGVYSKAESTLSTPRLPAADPSLSSTEVKLKLEEIRHRLTEKCLSLQKRREALLNRIKSNSHPQESSPPSTITSPTTSITSTTTTSAISISTTTTTTNSATSTSSIPTHVSRTLITKVPCSMQNSTHVTMPHFTTCITAPMCIDTASTSTVTHTTHKKSGTDSDGDSGIDLSLKRSKLGIKNSFTPKLRKYQSVLATPENLNTAVLPNTTNSMQTYQGDSGPLSSSAHQISNSSEHESSVTMSQSSVQPTQLSTLKEVKKENTSDNGDITKSVRFSHTNDIIESDTPRLVQLKQLAEESIYNHIVDTLQDTAVEQFDSDSDLSDSDYSSIDLSGIDPRIAQLALGIRQHSTAVGTTPPSLQSHNCTDTKASIHSDAPSDITLHNGGLPPDGNNVANRVAVSNHNTPSNTSIPSNEISPSSTLMNKKSESSPPESLCDNSLSPTSVINPSTRKNSPPKPPRLNVNSDTDSIASLTQPPDAQESLCISEGDTLQESVGPYSIVDVSAFKNKTSGKKGRNSKPPLPKTKKESKPPLPKSTPPKASCAKSSHTGNSLQSTVSDNVYEDVAMKGDNSRRSRLDKEDFEAPYTLNAGRPPNVDSRNDSDWESTMTDDDRSMTSKSTSHRATPSSNKTIPSTFSSPPSTAAQRGSTSDLWGSNASLYSSNEKLGSNSSLSGSRSSLFERVGSFKQAAKKKMKSLKRSLSLDRISSKSKTDNSELPPPKPLSAKKTSKSPPSQTESSSNGVPAIKKTLSWKSLNKPKFSKSASHDVNNTKGGEPGGKRRSPQKVMVPSPTSTDPSVASPNHFRPIGKLLELCSDGCQRIQLNKPPHGPYGLYISPSAHKSGFFVSRLSDSYPEKMYSGLLSVGDEIKEINGTKVTKLDHDGVLDLIGKSHKLILKVKSSSRVTSELWF